MQHIGTSGYSYGYWKNRFYPEGLAASKWLAYYATVFDTLELNSSFYKFPTVKTLSNAAAKTPEHYRITVKAHKIITHSMRMKDAGEKIREFIAVAEEGLGARLACILYQLPPSYSFTPERLRDILAHVPHQSRNVIEFRHASWWDEAVFSAFREAGLTFCSVSFPGLPEDLVVTSDLFYKRMHGVPELFKSSYPEAALQKLALNIKDLDGFVYFNNTMFEGGYENGRRLKELLDEAN